MVLFREPPADVTIAIIQNSDRILSPHLCYRIAFAMQKRRQESDDLDEPPLTNFGRNAVDSHSRNLTRWPATSPEEKTFPTTT
jgi:hypothetical protein